MFWKAMDTCMDYQAANTVMSSCPFLHDLLQNTEASKRPVYLTET